MNILVNGRSYFSQGKHGIWYDDGMGRWRIGLDENKGLYQGFAYYDHSRDFSPIEISGWKWTILNRNTNTWSSTNALRSVCV